MYDCLAGIFWVQQFVRDVLGGEIERYVLLGDSAGGNLTIVTTMWMIESGIKFLPKLVASCYGVLSGRYNSIF